VTHTVIVGYDPREHEAYEVCVASLRAHAKRDGVNVIKLDLGDLPVWPV
jgi:hypothetical protein